MGDVRDMLAILRDLIRRKEYAEAEAVLAEALESNPNSAGLLGMAAELYLKTDRLDKAERAINDALAVNPADAFSLQRKGDILAKQKRYPEALELFLDLSRRNTDDPFLVKRIARAYYLAGDYDNALEAAQRGAH